MTVKASISLTDCQDAFARGLVTEGKYSSVSAVIQRALDLLHEETEARGAETAALLRLLEQRRAGTFVGRNEARQRTAAMLAQKRVALGLDG